MPVAQRGFVTLDCSEPLALAEFWAAMLGGEVVPVRETTVIVHTGWTSLAMMKVEGYRPPTWPDDTVPKQIHLDLDVSDLEVAAAEAEAIGARPAAHQPAPDVRRVLFDPAGHPFCLTTQIPSGRNAR